MQQACRLALLRRSTWYRRSQAKDQTPLRMRIRELALNRPRFGYLRIHVLLRREGWCINRKRVHRLYRLDGLQVRMRVRRRKRLSLHRGPVPSPTAPNQHWSMDFVHDQLLDGRAFRILTVIDQWSRESVSVEAGFSLTGSSVAAVLEGGASRPLPKAITVDHGTEFTSRALDEWAWQRGVQLDFIRPGKPVENGLSSRLTGRLRDECLNVTEFTSLEHARRRSRAWQDDYNHRATTWITGSPDTQRIRPKRSEFSPERGQTLVQKCRETGPTSQGAVPKQPIVRGSLGRSRVFRSRIGLLIVFRRRGAAVGRLRVPLGTTKI